jgi:hypothetical protein
MLANRHKNMGTTGGAARARARACAGVGRRGMVAATAASRLSSSAAYLPCGEPGLRQGANLINDPRFTDQYNQI